jgi:hypothetical protein
MVVSGRFRWQVSRCTPRAILLGATNPRPSEAITSRLPTPQSGRPSQGLETGIRQVTTRLSCSSRMGISKRTGEARRARQMRAISCGSC